MPARATQPHQGKRPYVTAASVATLLFLAISFAPGVSVEKYRVSYVSLIPIVWAAYFLRRAFAIRPLDFALFALALVLHDLGAFGWYSKHVAGLEFDWCLHAFFGFVGGLVFGHWLRERVGVRGGAWVLIVILVVGGLSALHEVAEAVSNILFGEYGMLYVGPDNPYDSQWDMLSGVIGATTAAVGSLLRARRKELQTRRSRA
jgi:uncharacterized membrane protein YjdF